MPTQLRRTRRFAPIVNTLVATCLTGLSPVAAAPQILDRTVLPLAVETVGGESEPGLTYKDSEPYRVVRNHAPAGAPNVVIAMLDDTGFGAAGTFGGLIDTPNLDKLAAEGCATTAFIPPRCARLSLIHISEPTRRTPISY